MKVNQIAVENNNLEQPEGESNEKYLSRIRNMVCLSNGDMLQLIENQQKFAKKIVKFNQSGVENYRLEDYEKALIYLQEAEKVLEYAANCGKTIDRSLIITTLHNEAATYQKLLQMHKSYDYMEAILFNLKTYFQQHLPIPITPQITNKESHTYKQTGVHIHRKISTIVYNLQFAAISSQIERHSNAISAAKRALGMIYSVLEVYLGYNKYASKVEIRDKDIKKLEKYCKGIQMGEVENLCKTVRAVVRKVRESPSQDSVSLKLKKFSIGEVMQIQAISVEESNEHMPLQILTSGTELTKIVFYASICYYTIATQLRLIAKKQRAQIQFSHEYQKSKIFHLFAIKIALQFASFFSDYHEHIIRSFKNNYHIDLNAELPEYLKEQKIRESLLEGDSFVLTKNMLASQDLKSTIKVQAEGKFIRARRASSESLQSPVNGVPIYNLEIKLKKKKKEKSKEHINHMVHSRQTLIKEKRESNKKITLTSEKKLSNSSRTKLGKPKFTQQKVKKKSLSNDKTKDQTKKTETKNQRNRKKIMDEYMAVRESSKKKSNQKKNPKKLHNEYEKSKSKSKSKSKKQFVSPKSHTSGFKSTRLF